jgi:hypothetical protein
VRLARPRDVDAAVAPDFELEPALDAGRRARARTIRRRYGLSACARAGIVPWFAIADEAQAARTDFRNLIGADLNWELLALAFIIAGTVLTTIAA